MTVRFLHAADIHLDSPMRNLQRYEGAPYEQVRLAARQALTRVVDAAIERRVDFMIIAGDLYDGTWRDVNTGLYFVREATRLREAGIPLYFITGNHDEQSTITSSLRLPKNVDGTSMMLSRERPQTITLDDLGIAIHGRGFGQRAEQQNLAATYPAPTRGYFNIGVLHTSLMGSGSHNSYAPCTPAQLAAHGYQYWALGHIHQRGEHQQPDESPIVFPGNIQGRDAGELGPKGAILVETGGDQCRRTFLPFDVVRWLLAEVDASQCKHLDDFYLHFEQQLNRIQSEHPEQPLIIRCRVRGTTPLHRDLHVQRETLQEQLRQAAVVQSAGQVWMEQIQLQTSAPSDRTHPPDDGPALALSEVIAELRSSHPSGAPTDTAWEPIIESLRELRDRLPARLKEPPYGLKLDDQAWLAELLPEVEPLLLEQLDQSFDVER
jgi:DNA repair exonuclease SbcCD nuclease subunit